MSDYYTEIRRLSNIVDKISEYVWEGRAIDESVRILADCGMNFDEIESYVDYKSLPMEDRVKYDRVMYELFPEEMPSDE